MPDKEDVNIMDVDFPPESEFPENGGFPSLMYHKSTMKVTSLSINKDQVAAHVKIQNSRTSDELDIAKVNCYTSDLQDKLEDIIDLCAEYFNMEQHREQLAFASLQVHPKKGYKVNLTRRIEGLASPINISLPHADDLIDDARWESIEAEIVDFLIGAKESQLDMFEDVEETVEAA